MDDGGNRGMTRPRGTVSVNGVVFERIRSISLRAKEEVFVMVKLALVLGVLLVSGALLSVVMVPETSEASQSGVDLEQMDSGACAVSCPSGTPFAGQRGSVTCRANFSPICQCVKDIGKIAFCEPIASSQ